MRAIQIVLIALALVIMFVTLNRRSSQRSQAFKKVALVATVLLAISAIAAPGVVQRIAESTMLVLVGAFDGEGFIAAWPSGYGAPAEGEL